MNFIINANLIYMLNMFHTNSEPITLTELDEIFCNVNIKLPLIIVNKIVNYSQMLHVITIKIERNFIEESVFNDDKSNIYFYSMNFYSSIPYKQIIKQYDNFITNMSIEDYLFMLNNGYADSLAQYNKLPTFVFNEFIDHPDYVPPLVYDNENKYNIEYFAKYAYSYLKIAQKEKYFGFEIKDKGDIVLSCGCS